MSQIHHHYQANGIHLIEIEPQLEEAQVRELVGLIVQLYQPTHANYIILDLRGTYTMPIRALATEIKRCYREYVDEAPLFLAMVVEISVAQVLTTVLQTLTRRESIQMFTIPDAANQWLQLERKNLDA